MKPVFVLLFTLFFLAQPAHALFRAPKPAQTEQPAPPPAQSHRQTFRHVLSLSPFREKHRVRDRLNPVDRYNVTTPGTVAFACAMLGLVALAAVGITSFSMLIIPVFVFASLATVFGAVGVRRHKPGYAIAGLTLGMLEILGAFMMLALLL